MQTFLPYPIIVLAAEVLDCKRLGKQRVEAMQILNALSNEKSAWRNHPAVRMWRGYENCLKYYANTMIVEWVNRGYANTMNVYEIDESSIEPPPWLGDYRLHTSHKCNLVRKMPEYYWAYWPDVDSTAPYWWPVKLRDKKKQKEMEDYWN